MNSQNIAVSIVIPFYNGAHFIDNCLNCATRQFEKYNYEVILINDGSTDNSLEILKPWIEKYRNIYIISTENRGVSNARNIGIDRAQGEYVWFMDVDDLMSHGALEKIYEYAVLHNLDVTYFGLEKLNMDEIHNFKSISINIPNDIKTINGIEFLKFTHGLIWEYACSVQYLFKRNLLERSKIRFVTDLIYSEDLHFMWHTLPNVKRMRILPIKPYRYVMNPDSCLHSKKDRDIQIKKTQNLALLADLFTLEKTKINSIGDPEIDTIINCMIEDFIYRYMISLQQLSISLKEGIKITQSLKKKNLLPIGKYADISPWMPKGFKYYIYLKIINMPFLYFTILFIRNKYHVFSNKIR